MDKLRRVLSGHEENEELGLTDQVTLVGGELTKLTLAVWQFAMLMLTRRHVKWRNHDTKIYLLVYFPVWDWALLLRYLQLTLKCVCFP